MHETFPLNEALVSATSDFRFVFHFFTTNFNPLYEVLVSATRFFASGSFSELGNFNPLYEALVSATRNHARLDQTVLSFQSSIRGFSFCYSLSTWWVNFGSTEISFNLPTPFFTDVPIRTILVLITVYGVSVSIGFLLIFTLVLRYSNQIVTDGRKWLITLLFVLGFIGYFFLPGGVYTLTVNGTLTVAYSPELAIYFLVGTQTPMVLSFWLAGKTSQSFSDVAVQQRFRKFLLGLVCFEIMLITVPLVNVGLLPSWGIVFQILALPGAILTYLGVGKQL